jgi:hypothetical protein
MLTEPNAAGKNVQTTQDGICDSFISHTVKPAVIRQNAQ